MGAINPIDRRLQTNNPISLMGSLDPNYRESAGNQSAMQVHIGDYVLEGKSANVMHDLHQCTRHKTGRTEDDCKASRNPMPVMPNTQPIVSPDSFCRTCSTSSSSSTK